jgi:GntR family transcriptional regulator/MocR family aminotransferase
MLDRQGDLTQEQMLSELIYEGEIHRLLKKTYWSISKDAIFYTNVLKKILKMLSVLKPTGGWQYGYSLIRNFLNSTFRTSATL